MTRRTGGGHRRGTAGAAVLTVAVLLAAFCAGREPGVGGPPAPAAPGTAAPPATADAAAGPATAMDATPEGAGDAAGAPGAAGAPEATPGAPEAAGDAEPEALTAYDLVHESGLAELVAPALRLDFGAGQVVGPMLGRWRTAWGRDGEDEGRTVTLAGRSPVRLYLPADAIRGTVMRVTAKALGGRRISADIDGQSLGDATGSTVSYAAADFDVPEALEGNVTLKLTFRGSGRHATLGRGVALVDRIDFLTPEQAAAPAPPETPAPPPGGTADPSPTGTPDAAAETAGGATAVPDEASDPTPGFSIVPATAETAATLLQEPSTTIRFHAYVPSGARLLVGAAAATGTATAAVRAVLDGEAPVDLLPPRAFGPEAEALDLDLSAQAGRAVRLELSVAEGGALAWTAPRIVVPDRGRPSAPARTARNLIILLVDTLRADKLSRIDGTSEVQAENVQRWAAEGVSFTRAIAQENWTKPSVATLLTGLFPSSHAAQSERSVLPPEAVLISETLQQEGFATGCVIANGYVSDAFGFRRGWDMYRNYVRSGLPNRALNVFTDAAAWIGEQTADKRFFLYIQTIDPHVPYIPPREYAEMYDPEAYDGPVKASETSTLLERVKAGQVTLNARDRKHLEALYDGEISYHDAQAPLLWDALAEHGFLDDTLVVVAADHGEEFFEHGSVGHGHSLYEELLHVPLFFRLPGVFEGGGTIDTVVGLVDVLPTAFETLGLPVPETAQGRSLLPLAAGSSTGTEVAFTEFLEGQRAATGERLKIIQRGYRSVLFDLHEDPGENLDVAGEQPIALRTMLLRLARYLEWQERAGRDELQPRPAQDAQIDTELEQQLRALGYLGGPQR
ncbi:MAG: sulfatase [Deltaproteobacteria bacterium]|nr:sulfatase [Deltaproteobacteria bacterium]